MTDQKNTLLAIVLSALVLIGWQIFFGFPQVEKQKQAAQQQTQEQRSSRQTHPRSTRPAADRRAAASRAGATPQAPGQPAAVPGQHADARGRARGLARASSIETPRLAGSIALKGGRIDDLVADAIPRDRRSQVAADRAARAVRQPAPVLCRVRLGRRPPGTTAKLPTADTVWRQEGSGALTVDHPVTLIYDNGEGLEFRRTIAVDDKYLFTIKDEVANKGAAAVTLYPYALISRHGTPQTLRLLHPARGPDRRHRRPGPAGRDLREDRGEEDRDLRRHQCLARHHRQILGGDAAPRHHGQGAGALLVRAWPATSRPYQTDYLLDAADHRAGRDRHAPMRGCSPAPRKSTIVDGYDKELKLNRFELLIDWGWFYFITKPMFCAIDWHLPLRRQFRHRHPDRHRAGQDRCSSRSPTSPTPRWRR